jgi:hypothetical protein
MVSQIMYVISSDAASNTQYADDVEEGPLTRAHDVLDGERHIKCYYWCYHPNHQAPGLLQA